VLVVSRGRLTGGTGPAIQQTVLADGWGRFVTFREDLRMSSQAPIDLRSDTVTRPTLAMRRAMAEADVGDDVLEVDPTVDRLQRKTAELLGKEAALFMPSGSMTNQIAIRTHCERGTEFICEAESHIYNYEQAAFAQLSGLATRTVAGQRGVLTVDQLQGLVRPENEHMVRTRLVCLENTHNRAGGAVQPLAAIDAVCQWASQVGLRTHLDGARLWNAVAASRVPLDRWASGFDSVSVCFSKGLGAPVGSCLVGDRAFIAECKRVRKLFGGAMRQVGIIAAGALHALDHHRDRIVEDHQHAQLLADAVRRAPGLQLEPEVVETNILIVRIDPQYATAQQFQHALEEAGVRSLSFGSQHVRLITHLDVSRDDCQQAAERIEQVAEQLATAAVRGE
jgi:threonine aldolase